jgi:translation initiation factor 1 (eIF-1/SUI1)
VTAKYLTGAFADCITLVNATKGLTPKELARQLKSYGVASSLQESVDLIIQAQGSKQEQKMMELLKQVHYGQLLNFDYKF